MHLPREGRSQDCAGIGKNPRRNPTSTAFNQIHRARNTLEGDQNVPYPYRPPDPGGRPCAWRRRRQRRQLSLCERGGEPERPFRPRIELRHPPGAEARIEDHRGQAARQLGADQDDRGAAALGVQQLSDGSGPQGSARRRPTRRRNLSSRNNNRLSRIRNSPSRSNKASSRANPKVNSRRTASRRTSR